jgi:F-type H+-transporting ATPase subunit delta
MKQSPQAAARRYARALLDVAQKQGDATTFRGELEQLSGTIAGHKELAALFFRPGLGAERRAKLVNAVFGGRVSELASRLLGLLAERDRLALLPTITEAFVRLHNESRGVLPAEARSAVALDAAQQDALAAALKRATGRDIELKLAVDPSVLGGLLVTMGGRTYDGTVRRQLQSLRQRLSQGMTG